MMNFMTHICIKDVHGLSPVFPDRNHKRPDFQNPTQRERHSKPPLVDDLFPANTLRDDCIMLSEGNLRNLLAQTALNPTIEGEHLLLDVSDLIKALHPAAKKAHQNRNSKLYVMLRNIIRVAAEGRFVGGTHFVITPVIVKGSQDAHHTAT